MFRRASTADAEQSRLARFSGRGGAPTPPSEPEEAEVPPSAAEPQPSAAAGPVERVDSLRRSVAQRIEEEPEREHRAVGVITRLRSRWLVDRPDPLLLGAVAVVVGILGLAVVLVLSHKSSPRSQAAQAAAVPATPEPATPSPVPTVRAVATRPPRPTTSAALPAGTPTTTVPTPAPTPTPTPVATPPQMRTARSAPFLPPSPSPAPAPQQAAAPAAPALSDLVTNAANRSVPIVPAGQQSVPISVAPPVRSNPVPVPAAAVQPQVAAPAAVAQPPPQPPDLAPRIDSAASQAQRAAAAASQRGQAAGTSQAASDQGR